MTRDLFTVLWKEWIEIVHMRGSARSTVVMMMVPLLLLGIFFPLQFGRRWTESPVSLLMWGWIPLLLASAVVADSFAGERERHTLETLLASRLSDRSILFGKLLASVFYSLGMTFAIIMVGIVTLNIKYAGDGFIFMKTSYVLAGTAIGILGTTPFQRGDTRVAPCADGPSGAAGAQLFRGDPRDVARSVFRYRARGHTEGIIDALSAFDATTAGVAALAIITAIDCALIAVAMSRFTRDRLIGD